MTVKVGDKTYVTDTWESTFKKYTNNPDLIHNGFYLFEGLKAGDAVSVEFTATGYEPVTKTVVIKSNPAGQSNDNVTWLDITMTSNAPAKVASISVEDTKAVSLVDPIVITFSRKMDKESVEKAFSIDNDGEVTLTWINDYTLSVDVSKLVPLKTYNIKIDGSVAKNSQTNQPFDGNGDGNGGDDYTLSITMKEADTTPAQVVSTDPAIDGDVAYTLRPVVRVEYDEIIDWNEDKNADCMTVIDPEGNTYAGTLTHSVVNGASVLQYFFSEDLPLDKCFLVTVKPGLADLSGNLTEEFRFRFLSEYRPVVESTDLLPLDNVTGFWAPDGSGSSSGLTQEANSFTRANIGVRPESPNSACLKYDFDPDFAAGVWQIREYHSSQNIDGTTKDGVLTFWLYGDGSNNSVSAALRVRTNNKNGGIKYNLKPINYRGWHLVSWNLASDEYQHFTGTDEIADKWRFDSFFLKHEKAPEQAWKGEIYFNQMQFVKFDDTAVRKAVLHDFSSVETLKSADGGIVVRSLGDVVSVKADGNIRSVNVYNASGAMVASATPAGQTAMVATGNLAGGVYFVNVVADGGIKTVKIVR